MFLPAVFCSLVIADIVAAQQFFATKFVQRLFARHLLNLYHRESDQLNLATIYSHAVTSFNSTCRGVRRYAALLHYRQTKAGENKSRGAFRPM